MRNIIDRDIGRLEESIRALRSRRNELSPTEILCIIFSLTEKKPTASDLEPKVLDQVSQRWRSLALSAPELWTKIPLCCSRLGAGNVDKVKNG